MTWIQDILDATAEVESPKSFIYWSSLAALSAVLKKNVFLDKFYYKLYPNIYVMLVTDSGGRKGFPIWLAEQMVLKLDTTRFISGQNSIEGIITQLSKAYTKENGSIVTDANAFIVSGEFHELLLENDSALTILTSLYDTHSRELWKKSLKSGTETLKNVCITLLGASNEILLRKAVPDHAIEGGFMGRMLLIPDDKTGIVNALTNPPKKKFDVNELLPYLEVVSKIKGQFQYTPESKLMYECWYERHRKRNLKDKTGTLNRLHDQILKVAMLLSISEKLDLIITEKNLEEAINVVQGFTVNVGRITEGIGKSELATAMRAFLGMLTSATDYKMQKENVLRKGWGEFDSIVLTRIVDHFKEAGIIEIDVINAKTWYRLSDITIAKYTRFQEGEK